MCFSCDQDTIRKLTNISRITYRDEGTVLVIVKYEIGTIDLITEKAYKEINSKKSKKKVQLIYSPKT